MRLELGLGKCFGVQLLRKEGKIQPGKRVKTSALTSGIEGFRISQGILIPSSLLLLSKKSLSKFTDKQKFTCSVQVPASAKRRFIPVLSNEETLPVPRTQVSRI